VIARLPAAAVALAAATATLAFTTWFFLSIGLTNPTTAALAYLLIVLVSATVSPLQVALVVSVAATLLLNFFFLPPFGRFSIADPQNWVAFVAFLVVSLVAGNLSAAARERAREATARRDELRRLFDLSRDILLTDHADALAHLARHVAARFELESVALCLPEPGGWRIHRGGARELPISPSELDTALADTRGRGVDVPDVPLRLDRRGPDATMVPLRFGLRPVGFLALAGPPLSRQTLDALSGFAALAVERFSLLGERDAAVRVRERAELSDALLASFSHDLRTPLTAIELAASNLRSTAADHASREEQAGLIAAEVARLKRLFQNIVDMARIDADRVASDPQWIDPAEIVEAATTHAERSLRGHPLDVRIDPVLVLVDPRLAATAVGHLLENAAQYSPAGTPITVRGFVEGPTLVLSVRDHGAGVPEEERSRIFERFYRGRHARAARAAGTGMGLAIVHGLVSAHGGAVGASNLPDGGAEFAIRIPAKSRPAPVEEPDRTSVRT
jgi:two-component system, OmpR family, sensor histidine kinase KdpD